MRIGNGPVEVGRFADSAHDSADQRFVDVGEVGPAADDPDGVDRAGVHQRDLRQPLDLLGRGIAAVLGEDGGLSAQQAEVVEGLDARAAAGGQHDDVAVEFVEHPARRAAGVGAIVVQRKLLQTGRRPAGAEPFGQIQARSGGTSRRRRSRPWRRRRSIGPRGFAPSGLISANVASKSMNMR